jgi:serine/threonine protein kinase
MSAASPFPSTIDRLSDDDQERIAEILEQCMIELEQGVALDIEALTQSNPQLAEPLRRCLASLQTLHDAVQDLHETIPNSDSEQSLGRLGEFELHEVLGRGGMGIVYSAMQTSLQRRVAIKVMQSGSMMHPNRLKRFQLEAQSAARLQHPNIVPVFAVGEEAGVHYYAMQLIEGTSLDRADSERWTHGHFRTLIDAAIDLVSAIQHAHECGIVHRDIKPSNVLLDTAGKVWITDFGLAHQLDDHSMTQSGDVLGTANYMSPEQALGRPVDERTDIYSVATTLYEMATGRQAFPGARLQDILRKIESEEPTPPRLIRPDIPVDLETILLKGMSKDREDRYVSAQAFADDLRALRDGLPIRGRRPSLSKVASKWVARHKSAVMMGLAGVGLALMVSLIALVNISATRHQLILALAEVEAHLETSNENYWQSRSLLDRWNEKWLTQLATVPAAQEARSAMLSDTIDYYESFLDRAKNDPYLVNDLHTAHVRLGQALAQVGELELAASHFRSAVDGWAELEKKQAGFAVREWAIAWNELGLIQLRQKRHADAIASLTESVAKYQALHATSNTNISSFANLAAAHMNLAQAHSQAGDLTTAQAHSDRAEEIYRQLGQTEEGSMLTVRPLALLLDHRATRLVRSNLQQALRDAMEACELHRQETTRSPYHFQTWQSLGASLHNLAAIQLENGQPELAIQSLRSSLEAKEKVTHLNPALAEGWLEVASTHNAIATTLADAGKNQESIAHFEDASKVLRHRISLTERNARVRVSLAMVLYNWIKVAKDQHDSTIQLKRQLHEQLELAERDCDEQDLNTQINSLRRGLNASEVQS